VLTEISVSAVHEACIYFTLVYKSLSWYNRIDEDTVSSHHHKNPNIAEWEFEREVDHMCLGCHLFFLVVTHVPSETIYSLSNMASFLRRFITTTFSGKSMHIPGHTMSPMLPGWLFYLPRVPYTFFPWSATLNTCFVA